MRCPQAVAVACCDVLAIKYRFGADDALDERRLPPLVGRHNCAPKPAHRQSEEETPVLLGRKNKKTDIALGFIALGTASEISPLFGIQHDLTWP